MTRTRPSHRTPTTHRTSHMGSEHAPPRRRVEATRGARVHTGPHNMCWSPRLYISPGDGRPPSTRHGTRGKWKSARPMRHPTRVR